MRMLHAGSPTAEHLRLLTNIGRGVICQLPQLAIAGSVLARVVFGFKSEASLWREVRSSLFRFLKNAATFFSSPVTALNASSGMPSSITLGSRTPIRLLPQRIRWSRKLSGLPAQCPSSHRASLHKSTAEWVHVDAINTMCNYLANG